MDQTRLEPEQKDEGVELVNILRGKNIDVRYAYWLNTIDDGRWYLHLVMPDLERIGIREAYKAAHEAISTRPKTWFGIDPFDVKVEGSSNPIARAIDSHFDKYGDDTPIRVTRARFEGVDIDDMYIYPRNMVIK